MKKKVIVTIIAAALILCLAIGGTIAWLTDSTDSVTNTFTVGNIDIDLTETFNKDTNADGTMDAWEGKMVPGKELTKDPKVTVKADSEDCWLFVKVEEDCSVTVGSETKTFSDFLAYAIDTGWTQLSGVDDVYYREVSSNSADQEFVVLQDNKVTVNGTVTKDMMDALATDPTKFPTLTFTAYACQKDGFDTAVAAWTVLNN